jgi:hypothetical protein
MSDAYMSPEEMAWASQNAGRPPEARKATSQEFAARARAEEDELLRKRAALLKARMDLQRRQLRQDREWNDRVHHQDMQAAAAHHRALMQGYSLVDQARAELGAMNVGSMDWKQGFAAGVVGGLFLGSILKGLLGRGR